MEVTGSKHLLELNGRRVLLDCGMFQGRREEAARKNRAFPFDVSSLDSVVLSHAHIDHSGLLPMLARHNFRGRIYCTPATRNLCAIMLMDSAHIQERDAKWLSKRNETFVPPLYAQEDAQEIMRHFMTVDYDMPFDAAPGISVTFKDAGHILGSAMVLVEYVENDKKRKFIFSADIGRRNAPILEDPWAPDDADAVMMESTYGNRDHDPIGELDDQLADVVNRTYKRGGKLIVPSFALERAQEFVYALKRLEVAKRIPNIPVYVDSPLTVNITEVFRLHTGLFDDEIRDLMNNSGDPFELVNIQYIRNVEQSKQLNSLTKPAIIISASGMCEFGRILHHLRNNITDEKNTVLIIGFQAKNTLGRHIVERDMEVKIFGMKVPLHAEVKVLNALSAHAGRSELLDFGRRFKDRAEKIMLVHGEEEGLNALKEGLEAEGCKNVIIMAPGEPVTI